MSVITNKDRINENNDRINRLIALVKQKALTSNPKFATTEDEMDAMITDKHVGKVVKYLGEGGGVAVGTPIAVGDTLDKLYFNTSVTPDFDALSYEYDETSDGMRTRSVTILNLASYEGALVINRMSGDNGHAEIIASGSMQFYINGEGNVGGMEMTPETFGLTAFGWQTDIFDMTQYADQSEFSDTTVATVNQQDLWGSYISKEPFAAGGKYAKNALYIIAEGESEVIENPTAVGDEVTQIYFDTTKSAEEVYNALMQLDWDNLDYEDVPSIYLFGGLNGDGSKDNDTAVAVINMSMEGKNICQIVQKETPIFMYSPNATPSDLGAEFEDWGWLTTSPVPSFSTFTVGYVRDKDIWGSWLSAHENGFASVGGPAAPRARRLNITEGSLAINENGKFDVSNMESVDINIKPRMMTAVAEAEMTALLVEDNLGQVVKYVGEAALVGTPFAVGDTIDKIYFDTSLSDEEMLANLNALTYNTRGQAIMLYSSEAEYDNVLLAAVDMSVPTSGATTCKYIFDVQNAKFIYATEDVIDYGITKGWQNLTDGVYTISTSHTITAVEQQDLWSSYISKEPFAAGGKYETNALYLISETESASSTNAPIAVGDTLTKLYFDTSVTPDVSGLTGSAGVSIVGFSNSNKNIVVYDVASVMPDAGSNAIFFRIGDYILYSSEAFDIDGMSATQGWNTVLIDGGEGNFLGNGVLTFEDASTEERTVTEVNQQDLWGAYISKEPFTSDGSESGVTIAAKRLQVVD